MFNYLLLVPFIPTFAVAFQHSLSTLTPARTTTASTTTTTTTRPFIVLHSSSFSQESPPSSSSSSSSSVNVDVDVNIQPPNSPAKRLRKRKRRPITNRTPSQDVNFLLKRTQYLLDLTPSSLKGQSQGQEQNPDEEKQQEQHKMKIHRNTFHWLIDAWAKTYHPKATHYAHALLDQMIALSSTEGVDVGTDAEADAIRSLITPNARSYTKVMNAYANAGTPASAIKAEELCMGMIQNIKDNGGSDSSNNDDVLLPTTRSYNAIIQAYSNSGMHARAQKAEEFITKMESLYEENKNDDKSSIKIIKPNTINYNTILTAYANSGMADAADHTERILRNVIERPNVISYNACIDAWAKSGHSDSGVKAFELLQEMNELYESSQNERVKPNTRSYNSVMNAYAKSTNQDGPQRAEEILDTMEELYENGNDDVKPDFFSFATVINAWGRSYQFGKGQRVLNIFRHMSDLYEKGNESVRPNVVIYNAIINACAYTIGDMSEQRRAMEIAHVMIQDLEKSPYAFADQVTYGTFLKVCENQMPPSDTRLQLVNVIFRKCAKDGQMGKLVIDQLKSITTPDQFREIVGFSSFDKEKGWKDLPLEWRCNVVEGKKRRRTKLH